MTFNLQRSKDIVVKAALDTLLYHAEYDTFLASDVHARLESEFSSGFVQRMLISLANDQLIKIDQFDELSERRYTLTDQGFEEAQSLPTLRDLLNTSYNHGVPASDRIVPLDHNSVAYSEILSSFDDVIRNAREANEFNGTDAERDRLIHSLAAAKELWAAAELKVVQIKVGILMALDDAEIAFAKVGKSIGAAMLVDLIVTFVKNKIGLDL